MWIGVVIALFMGDPLGALGGAAVAAVITLWLRWIFKRVFPR